MSDGTGLILFDEFDSLPEAMGRTHREALAFERRIRAQRKAEGGGVL